MREKIINEVERLLRENISPHELLREVQKVPYAHIGLDKERNADVYGVRTNHIEVDRDMIIVDGSNAPDYVVSSIYFAVPGIRVYSTQNPMMGGGGNHPHYSIEGRVSDITLKYTPHFDNEGNQIDGFQVQNANYAVQHFDFKN